MKDLIQHPIPRIKLFPLMAPLLWSCASAAAASPVDRRPAPRDEIPAASTRPADSSGLEEGAPAPDFVAPAQDGTPIALSGLRGRTIILFFYTRDETPGTIREALDFRDRWPELRHQGISVVGVSTDTIDAHKKFAERLRLPYPLLADTDGALARAFGVPVSYGIADRQTFIIDSAGNIERIYRSVDVADHVADVVAHID